MDRDTVNEDDFVLVEIFCWGGGGRSTFDSFVSNEFLLNLICDKLFFGLTNQSNGRSKPRC